MSICIGLGLLKSLIFLIALWVIASQRFKTLCVFAGARIFHITTDMKNNVM